MLACFGLIDSTQKWETVCLWQATDKKVQKDLNYNWLSVRTHLIRNSSQVDKDAVSRDRDTKDLSLQSMLLMERYLVRKDIG